MMGRILRVALPAVLQRGAPNLAMSLLTRFVSWYGAPMLSARTSSRSPRLATPLEMAQAPTATTCRARWTARQ